MKSKYLILILAMVSCQKIYFEDEPANNAVNNFEIFWSDFDRYYSQFNIRGINWGSLYNEYRPMIFEHSTEQRLYNVLSSMITVINDMHVNLFTPFGTASWRKPYPDSYPSSNLIADNLSIHPIYPNSVIGYGKFQKHNIGYIKILTFQSGGNVSNKTDSRYLEINNILEKFKDTDEIIIDVRMNGGGNSSNAELIASRFADIKRLYCRRSYKNGLGKNDFSE